jgi:cytochrome c oxidase assembly factor CtaG
MISTILIEAFVVGILNLIFGFVVSYLLMGEQAKAFKHWPGVLLGFFISGILVHLFCEFSGINKQYCKTGNACQ